jgi:hypothetical protein
LTGSVAKVHHPSYGFTDLLAPVRQQSFKQSQSFCAIHLDPVRILGAVFSFPEERKGAIKVIFYSQQSRINLL